MAVSRLSIRFDMSFTAVSAAAEGCVADLDAR
jgi:hypothetical protein